MSKIISGSQTGREIRMQIISRANFELSLKVLPFVVRLDMVADIQPSPRRGVSGNSRVRAIVGFCLIRQSSVSPTVWFHQPNQIPAAVSGGAFAGARVKRRQDPLRLQRLEGWSYARPHCDDSPVAFERY
jgi:hypothetical protein